MTELARETLTIVPPAGQTAANPMDLAVAAFVASSSDPP